MADQEQPQEQQPQEQPQAQLQPDAQSDADKIRAKRLAKLGGSSGNGSRPSPTASPAPSSSTKETSTPVEAPATSTPPPTAKPASAPPVATANNPFSQLGLPDKKPPPKITIRPQTPSETSRSATPKAQEFNVEAWTDQTLSSIFRITLDGNNPRDAHGHKLYFAESVRRDLEEENKPIRLTTEILDQAILEAASSKKLGKPLEYLLACWKRVSGLFRGLHNKEDVRYGIIKEARRLCFNYCIFAATIPDMFGEEDAAAAAIPLAEYLLADPNSDRGLCHDFLNEAVSRFSDPENGEDVKAALVSAMEQLSRQLAMITMNDDYKPYVLAMRNFARYPALLNAMVESPMFLPSIPAQHIETMTLLGPFFRLSPMQIEVAQNYFSSPGTRDPGYIANSQKALRMSLQTHQDELFDIANCFVKLSKESREKILDWFALAVNLNHKKRAIQVDPQTVSSDGFMVNISVILDRLCEPFMDATFSKIDRIDLNYFHRKPRVKIEDETKINADQKASDEFYSRSVEGSNNFITEVFFLTVAAHHYGLEAANSNIVNLAKNLKWQRKHLEQFETERHKYMSNPAQLALFENALKKLKDRIDRIQSTIMATEGVLLDELTQARSMQFMRYVIVWLLRLVSGATFPQKKLELPLPKEQPLAFQCLPEYFLEDIVDNFKFITRRMPHIITSTQSEELVQICITFLRSSEYIKNPYLKSGLVTILCHGVLPFAHRAKGILGDVLFAHEFATKHLLHALMKFYIECETTGAHTQFFDKFNIRWEIFQVIKCVWPNPVYRENLATEARVNLDFFVQFVNMLLNDVTFVLDESFTAFTQIHDLSKLLKNPPSDMTTEARQEQEEKLSAAQDRAKSYMQLTNETVAMLKLFTEALSDSFTKPEVVVRLAHMLDYNLDALVGPRRKQLAVENPESYNFNPKQMLAEITDVFLNLKEKNSFIQAVATDGRSYKPENFTTAMSIMKKYALKSPEQLRDWEYLGKRVEAAKEAAEMEEADLGELPDEYTDPLLATLMEDPVQLPASRAILDRSTIQSHLLSDAHDPFNRMPLRIEDVIPLPELKEKIQEWKARTLAKKVAERRAAKEEESGEGGEPMDTS